MVEILQIPTSVINSDETAVKTTNCDYLLLANLALSYLRFQPQAGTPQVDKRQVFPAPSPISRIRHRSFNF